MEKPDDHPARFGLDGRDACHIHLGVFAGSATRGAVAVYILAVQRVIIAGGCVTDAEAGGIFDDDPGKKQAAKFNDSKDQ